MCPADLFFSFPFCKIYFMCVDVLPACLCAAHFVQCLWALGEDMDSLELNYRWLLLPCRGCWERGLYAGAPSALRS